MLIDLSESDIRHIRNALVFTMIMHKDMVEDGRWAALIEYKDLDELIKDAADAVSVQNELKAVLAKLPELRAQG